VFTALAEAVRSELGGVWGTQMNGLDQRYWDLLVGEDQLTVHLEHYLGMFLCFRPGCPAHLIERAAAAVPDQEEWTFRIAFSAPFCPGIGSEPLAPLTSLTDQDDHIHAALEIRVQGRLLPRLGFWGPHDVCLNTWLVELRGAVHVLDASPEATVVFDEGEQGQPLFKFRRSSATLFFSIEDSPVSAAPGDPDWREVACDYEDFRFQVFRLFGALRNALMREVGTDQTNAWFHQIEGRITQGLQLPG
jgi:hypothetical protein